MTRSKKNGEQRPGPARALPQPYLLPARDAAARLGCSVGILLELAAEEAIELYIWPPIEDTTWNHGANPYGIPFRMAALGMAVLKLPSHPNTWREIARDDGAVEIPLDAVMPLMWVRGPDEVFFGDPYAGWSVGVDDLFMLREDVEAFDLATPDDEAMPHPTKWRNTLRATERIIAGLAAMVVAESSGAPPGLTDLARRILELVPTEDRKPESIAKVLGAALRTRG